MPQTQGRTRSSTTQAAEPGPRRGAGGHWEGASLCLGFPGQFLLGRLGTPRLRASPTELLGCVTQRK